MKINKHSIIFKTLLYLISFSIIFIVFLSVSINNMFSTTYTNLEKDKISLIQKNISSPLALNISYGFNGAVKEIVNKTLKNENVLLVQIKEYNPQKEFVFTNFKNTIEEYKKRDEFISTTELLDPANSKKIASLTIIYSKKNYFTYMEQLYLWLFWGVLGLILAIILLIYFLLKSLKRLSVLASAFSDFNPEKPKKLKLDVLSNDEVSSIATSANIMVDNLIKYLKSTKDLNQQLSKNQVHLKDAQRIAKVGSWEYNIVNNTLTLSDEIFRILQIKRKITLSWRDALLFICDKDREYVVKVFDNAIKNGSYFDIQYSVKTKNDNIIYMHTRGKVRKKADGSAKITATSMDVTEDKINKQTIEKLAYYDALTELPNRTLLKDRIHKSLQNAQRQKNRVAVLFLDLDHFKLINDTLGHSTGDKLLVYISKLLQTQIRKSDTISRIGGDEFVILLQSINSLEDAELIAKNLLKVFDGKHIIDTHNLYITTSIGISLYPDNSKTMDELITNADTAMYDAKKDGRNKYKVYSPDMSNYISVQMQVEQDLKNAVKNQNELEVYYQAKIDTTGTIVLGAEALIRWNHPTNGLMFPDEFIEVAESTGIILELGKWIIKECIEQVRKWNQDGYTELKIAINLSARQFQDNDLVPYIVSMIEKYNVDPSQLEFEVTETVSMTNMETTLRILNQLKNIGVTIAIDDFGTGYSSLSYLKKFPVNTLKIDKSFVTEMTIDEGDRIIVETIISMAHTLGFKTVAEGVETKDHVELLRSLKCDQIQGYYYSKPITKDAFSKFLLKYNPLK